MESADSPTPDEIEAFISRWSESGGHERANYAPFLIGLCSLLRVPEPDPAKSENTKNEYTFERAITRHKPDGTAATVFVDLYRAGHFVLETKQGVGESEAGDSPSEPLLAALGQTPSTVSSGHGKRGTAGYDKAMVRAYNQAEKYIHDLPAEDGRPPFLIVCDVGHRFEIYAEFTRSGGRYRHFPDPKNHRIYLDDLRSPEKREILRAIWTDPLSLDPSKRVAKVTREIAALLAELAKSLEANGHPPESVAVFLQRCLFTMFAEDIGLLPENSFLDLLEKVKDTPAGFPTILKQLWDEMATGTDFSTVLFQKIAHFNGGLFDNPTALPLAKNEILTLIGAAKADWTEVDPAIFGTLLERALDPHERHKLGAHYTPRSYVERLIEPTVISPLREEWEAVKAAAVQLLDGGKDTRARSEVEEYHHRLCKVRVLDPACGSGNFLYVTLEHLKILEAEVLDFLESIGGDRTLEMEGYKVRPDQFHGLEINPAAKNIAQLVLWIGYFQWHHKTTGKADTNDRPLLPKQNTILHQDAVLEYDEKIPRKNEDGSFVTVWDGRTTKPSPVTGKEVPDETKTKVLFDFTNPRRPKWPEADFIVGNPPFLGSKRMRAALGDGYLIALYSAWKNRVPGAADFVFYWWRAAAELLQDKQIRRFGFITTNSLSQHTARRMVEPLLADKKKPIHIAFAIPDHPWIDSSDGAAVRIAMSVAATEKARGIVANVTDEVEIEAGEHSVTIKKSSGIIAPNLTVGIDVSSAKKLAANQSLCWQGCKLVGAGFQITPDEANSCIEANSECSKVLRSYWAGSDITKVHRPRFVIDLFGLSREESETKFPRCYQLLLDNVYPDRAQNRDKGFREKWWLFGRPRPELRDALAGLPRYIVTSEVAKHRTFTFLKWPEELIDGSVMAMAADDGLALGVVSGTIHKIWSLNSGGRLEDRPRYQASCFETFPFPDPDEPTKDRIRKLGEKLDAHRKRQQAAHPDLTLTGIYNVLEKLRSGEALNPKEKKIHDDGLVSVLKQIHDDLDAAVFAAYGWSDLWERLHKGESAETVEAELLERLVALNHERAEEEKTGKIRWLRPDFQNPGGDTAPTDQQGELAVPAAAAKPAASKATAEKWPAKDLPEQVAAVRRLIPETGTDPAALSARFGRKSAARENQISQILSTLTALGQL